MAFLVADDMIGPLATLLKVAQQHITDIETGIEEGLYNAADNADLAGKKTGLSAVTAFCALGVESIRDASMHQPAIAIARHTYASNSADDIEIDDEPAVSVADDGIWINAWVWVPNPVKVPA